MTNVLNLQNSNAEDQTAVLMRIKAKLDAKEVTSAQLAREISSSPATVSQILNGKYQADATAIVTKLAKWLTRNEEKKSSPVVNPGFVMTTTAKQIMDDMTYAQISESIVVIYGASGVGKSEALREYKRNNNNVWHVTASPSRSSLTECLYELAMELDMEQAPRRKGPLSRVIRKRLMGTEGLIVIDEADHLDYPTLEELRILQEETGVGMVLVGNNRVYTQLTGGRRNEDFARLFSRIAKKRGIHKTKVADVKAIGDAWNVSGDKERALMQKISERPGGLRLLTKTLKLAAMFCKGELITEKALRAAFNELENND
ncbi:DNA transposition protein [Marinomonas primoryensis]|uniref:DNA transposition protein n=1 Tax=Marinomonas primoryensis TaxID=178399 RepID=A0A2Z4PXP1_9GAMM|nr:AAA family ATPase [Marinomonas primoryensis]AWX98706.1 DNA transposition protein [Marinomonas primoryensis]AWY02217.1 DNA transposition protein [Marinomonas primoryensis]